MTRETAQSEEQWLLTVRARLAAKETRRNEVQGRLTELEEEASLLAQEVEHLKALLPPNAAPVPAVEEHPARGAPDRSEVLPPLSPGIGWELDAIAILRETGEPLHYRELFKRLRSRGHRFGGQNPAATFLTALTRADHFQRVGRGVYSIAVDNLATTSPMKS
jgi:hypothetical protein